MRILFLILLIGLVGGAWWLARRSTGADSLNVTVVFEEPSGLRAGDPVLLGDQQIGSVQQVVRGDGGLERVSIVVDGRHQGDVRSDSVWAVRKSGGAAALVIDNRVAVGPSLQEGEEVRGGVDPTREWLARGRDWIGRVSSEAESLWKENDREPVERQFDEWSARVPEWKERGSAAFAAAREEVARRAKEAEQKLRASGRIEEADRVGEQLRNWLDQHPEPQPTQPEEPAGQESPAP